jgi:hypothetical protein
MDLLHLQFLCSRFLKLAQLHGDSAQNDWKARSTVWALDDLYEYNNMKSALKPDDLSPEVGFRASHHADNDPAPQIPTLGPTPINLDAWLGRIEEALQHLAQEVELAKQKP